LTDLNVTAHVFCNYNLAIILTFLSVLELWLMQHQLNCEQFFLYNYIDRDYTE